MKARYPVYVISKGRSDCCLTADAFVRDGVEFRLAVEPQEEAAYRRLYGDRVLVTPFSNLGLGSIPVRNFVWQHAIDGGHARHWVFDDNIGGFLHWGRGERLPCHAKPAICSAEDFVDRYENVAIAGFNYDFIGATNRKDPFSLNCHVYSSLLIWNALPYRWRGRYNEDTDLCLQVLSGGWCTVLFNVFLIGKKATMTMKGGNTEELYKGDGRLRMARSLERMWPGVVKTSRRWKRPQHVVDWAKFDTPLRLKPGVDLAAIAAAGPNEYGKRLVQVADEVKSAELRAMLSGSAA